MSGAKAAPEEVVERFVAHFEGMRASFVAMIAGGGLTGAKVIAHSAEQKAEQEAFDAWLASVGWTGEELFALLRDLASEIKAKRGGAR